MDVFYSSVKGFIESLLIPFNESEEQGLSCLLFPYKKVCIVLVPISFFNNGNILMYSQFIDNSRIVFVYEDRWRYARELMESHLRASLGLCGKVFARNCYVKRVNGDIAQNFFLENHIYGGARAKFHYGLFRKRRTSLLSEIEGCADDLLAVASFSSPRKIARPYYSEKMLNSYEWVRYASCRGLCVIGGMGKIMNYFIEDVHPEDIMSYADLEWSDGNAYRQLGFRQIGEHAPIDFLVNTQTMERVSIDKIGRDKRYQSIYSDINKYPVIKNLGSTKWAYRVL